MRLLSHNYTFGEVERLMEICKKGDTTELIQHLKNGIDPNERYFLGWSGLHVAVANRNHSAVEALIKAGAQVDIPDEFALICDKDRHLKKHLEQSHRFKAVQKIRNEYFHQYYKKLGVPFKLDYRGCTPLHYAVLADDVEMIILLLEAGADPYRPDIQGRTPLDYAHKTNEVIEYVMTSYTEKKQSGKLLCKTTQNQRQDIIYEETMNNAKKTWEKGDSKLSYEEEQTKKNGDSDPIISYFVRGILV